MLQTEDTDCCLLLIVACLVGGIKKGGLGWVVEESDGLRKKTVQVPGGSGSDGVEPATKWKFTEEAVSQV